MQVAQIRWTAQNGWGNLPNFAAQAELVLVFADADYFQTAACFDDLRERFPLAQIAGCSSAGNVGGTEISDGNLVASVIKLNTATVKLVSAPLSTDNNSRKLGESLMSDLLSPELRHVFILSDGLQVNGSELAQGLNQAGISVTGGLAGDGTRFGKTWVMANAPAMPGQVAAIGLYGEITVKSGCFAGWEEFGAQRYVTKSVGNVVYEIDNEKALQLYKRYLGELANELPASGLRFPFSIQATSADKTVIRTLLAVDEEAQSLTFAGDVPQGFLCKLMRTNVDSLIESAGMAAESARAGNAGTDGLCLVVSCVGRRLVMGQLTEEELEIVQEKLGKQTTIAGFYSYGELAPFSDVLLCQLHNQTMTLTTLYE